MNSPILKFTAPYLHDGTAFHRNKVLVTAPDGKILDLIPLAEAGEDVQKYDGILCPGLINAHCHLELSHLAGIIPEHTGLVDFILALLKMRDESGSETILQSAEKADQLMHENGIVAVGDISNKTDTARIKQSSHLYYHTFIEAIGFSEERAAASMQQAQEIVNTFRQQELAASIVPHAPYSVSGKLFDLIGNMNREAVISIHNQESSEENKLYLGGKSDFYRLYRTLKMDYSGFQPTGTSSLKSWLPCFRTNQNMILVHNTFTEKEDIAFAEAAAHHVYWCLCPHANLYIEKTLPPVDLLRKEKVKIVVGTDSLASNHQLSVLEEIKTLQFHFPELPTEELLRWATLNGAQALHLESRFGSFEPGKQPGIVQINAVTGPDEITVKFSKESKAFRIK